MVSSLCEFNGARARHDDGIAAATPAIDGTEPMTEAIAVFLPPVERFSSIGSNPGARLAARFPPRNISAAWVKQNAIWRANYRRFFALLFLGDLLAAFGFARLADVVLLLPSAFVGIKLAFSICRTQ
jgi:hypothetical protein